MKLISLTQGQFAKVDDEDFEWLSQWKWSAQRLKTAGIEPFIAVRKDGNRCVLMHRIIVNVELGMVVDHINHVMLDNQKGNLRVCTYSQNSMNKCKQLNNTSGFTGVTWHHGKWEARIMVNRKSIYLGSSHLPNEAYRLYQSAVHMYFGQFVYQEDLRDISILWSPDGSVSN